MKVEMLRDYYGTRKGQIVDLGGVGEILIRRGFAKAYTPQKPKRKRTAKQESTTNG